MKETDSPLRSGDLAKLTGLSPDTIRHYERVRVLPEAPRTASGYRVYGRDAVDRVRLVQRALQLGFSLSELSEILKVRDCGGVPCHRVLKLTEEKLRHLGEHIEELRETQHYMRRLVKQWRKTLAHTEPGHKAMLLHSLADDPLPVTKPTHNLKGRNRT